MDGALGVAGASAAALGFDKLANVGVLYPGLQTLGGGAIPTGLVLAAIGANVIDKKFVHAAAFALAGAVLTFFGFMHGEAVGIAVTPTVAVAYGIVAVFLYALSRYPALAPALTGPGEIMAASPAERANRVGWSAHRCRPYCAAAKTWLCPAEPDGRTLKVPILPQFACGFAKQP
jgi:AGZA family xanthine/uracil permease-like MFS transporter